MPTVARVLVLAALGLCTAARAVAGVDASSVAGLMAIDREAGRPWIEKQRDIRSVFARLEPEVDALLARLPDAALDDLERVWALFGFMAYATDDPEFARRTVALHDEYERRGVVPPQVLRQRLLTSLISMRQFDEARQYAQRAQVPIEPLPRVEGPPSDQSAGLRVLQVDVARGVLRRQDVQMDEGLHVFVVSFIGCAFSRQAADAIEKHEPLSRWMRERSTWIVLPGLLHFDDVRAWNRQHPSTGFAYIERLADWSFVDDVATPTFYVLRGGKLVAKWQGWPDDATGIAALLRATGGSEPQSLR